MIYTGVHLENYNLHDIQRVTWCTIGLIREGNMANNMVYSGGSGPVGCRSCAGQGVHFSGPVRKQGLWFRSWERCRVRRSSIAHIDQYGLASIVICWSGLEVLWIVRSVSHSGVVGQVLVEYTVGSATFDRDRVRTWRWYHIIQDVKAQLWSCCTGLEDIGIRSSSFQGGVVGGVPGKAHCYGHISWREAS